PGTDSDGDLLGVRLTGSVADLVDRIDRFGLVPRNKAERVSGHEHAAACFVRLLGQGRVQVEFATIGIRVVLQDRNRYDVAGADRHFVGLRLRSLQLGGCRNHLDRDVTRRRGLAIGNRVLQGQLPFRPDVADLDHRVVQHGHTHRQPISCRHRLHYQDAACGIRVVAQDIDHSAPAAGQEGYIAHSYGRAVAVSGDDVDAHQLLGTRRSVGHHIGDVVGSDSTGIEGERLLVRSDYRRRLAVGLALATAKRAGLGIGVVLQWGDHRVLARYSNHVVRIRDGWQGSGSAHIHADLALRGERAIRDFYVEGLPARPRTRVLEGEQAVRPDPDLVSRVAAGSSNGEDVVAAGA